jgi:hypothetical protein
MNRPIVLENFLKQTPQVPSFSDRNQHYLISGANPLSYLDDGTQEEQVAPMSASIDWAKVILIDNYGQNNKNAGVNLYTGGVVAYGQSFLNDRSQSLTQVKFLLTKTEASAGNLDTSNFKAYVYAATGTAGNYKPTGSALGTSGAQNGISINTSPTYGILDFLFTGGVALTAGTRYIVVFSASATSGAATDANNYITAGVKTSVSGTENASSLTGSTWTANTNMLVFYAYNNGTGSTDTGTAVIEGNIMQMVSSTEGTYSTYAITDTTKVYGITNTSITDLGYIDSTSHSNNGGYLAIGGGGTTSAGWLFATYGAGNKVYKMPLASGSWTNFGTITTGVGVHIMEPFLDFIALKDGDASYTQGGLVKKIDVTAFTISSGIDLGAGFGVMQMRNYNNKYLAIAGGKIGVAGADSGYTQNYIFLWDGISSRYNYSVKVPGKFIDMKVVDSVLYVAVQVASKKTCIYYLYGTRLIKSFTTQISTISQTVNTPVSGALFNFKNYLGVRLADTSDFTAPLLINGKDEVGEIEFIYSSGKQFEQFCVGYDGNIYTSEYKSDIGNIYYLPTTGIYQQISYLSQWIPVKNLSGIDIYYDAPPTLAADSINVTIYGRGEDIISGSSTTALTAITSTAYLTTSRTRLDIQGFTGDKIKIKLTTTNTTFKPIIRKISLI